MKLADGVSTGDGSIRGGEATAFVVSFVDHDNFTEFKVIGSNTIEKGKEDMFG